MESSCNNKVASVTRCKKTIATEMKLKLIDLLKDVEDLESRSVDNQSSIVQYLTEMMEENKLLSKKCRELAYLVKSLKHQNKELSTNSKLLNQIDNRKCNLELQDQLECLKSELMESRTSVQLLTAQVETYKEDFEMERKDRERAVVMIGCLENKLAGDDSKHKEKSYPHCSMTNQQMSYNSEFFYKSPPTFVRAMQLSGNDCHVEGNLCLPLIPRGSNNKNTNFLTTSSDSSEEFSTTLQRTAMNNDELNSSCNNKHKRKLNHQDSFDNIFNQKLLSLE